MARHLTVAAVILLLGYLALSAGAANALRPWVDTTCSISSRNNARRVFFRVPLKAGHHRQCPLFHADATLPSLPVERESVISLPGGRIHLRKLCFAQQSPLAVGRRTKHSGIRSFARI